uniref:Uncharacterized protein n=1 Tax=Heterorhabditis bacteriophora TaxID=37862 RepID=A0A1I7WPR5_HETBA
MVEKENLNKNLLTQCIPSTFNQILINKNVIVCICPANQYEKKVKPKEEKDEKKAKDEVKPKEEIKRRPKDEAKKAKDEVKHKEQVKPAEDAKKAKDE